MFSRLSSFPFPFLSTTTTLLDYTNYELLLLLYFVLCKLAPLSNTTTTTSYMCLYDGRVLFLFVRLFVCLLVVVVCYSLFVYTNIYVLIEFAIYIYIIIEYYQLSIESTLCVYTLCNILSNGSNLRKI